MNVAVANAPSGAKSSSINTQIIMEKRLKEALNEKEAMEVSLL
jgi:hypothetical protein